MFTAKKNNTPQPNSALHKKTPFIQPEMKVVKSDNDKEKASKDSAKKTTEETPDFFQAAPQKVLNKVEEKTTLEKKEGAKELQSNKGPEGSKKGEQQGKMMSSKGKSSVVNALKGNNAVPKNTAIPSPEVQPDQKVEAKETGKEEVDKKEKEPKGKVEKAEKKIPKAPTKPEDDPAFQQQIKETEKTKEEKSQHPEASAKVTEQKEAGYASAEAQSKKNDQEVHAESMSEVSEKEKEREPFTPESFKKLLEKNLEDLEDDLPKNSDEAKEFKEDKPIEGIKENISGQVTAEGDKLAGPMKSEANKPAPASGKPTEEVKPLPAADPGKPPKQLDAKAAIPKPKTSEEISMEKESQSLDDYMTENEVTDEQLAKSNEPKFTGALDEKNKAQTEAKLAPSKYRKKEQAQLGAAQKVASVDSKEGLDQMQAAKVLSENTVLTNQTTNKTNDKTEQEKIYAEFETIYNDTKKKVTDSLEKLSEDVDKKFSEEAESAQKTFEKNVEDGLGEIYGWTVIDDWIFGEDTEAIDKLFRVEKNKFITKMNSVLDDISIIIADGLNGALDAIAEGKKKSKEKFDSLDASQKKLAEDAFNDFNDQYADLEDTVYEKQEELAADLAQSYKENVDVLQEKFDEIKERVSAGWIGAALNALAGVIKTILKIKDLLLNLLAAAASAIGAIISDPIGFLSNLISGIKQGFVDFGNNIKQHMIKGLIEWLTGSLGNVGITLPDNLFSLSGIFSLVAQMLGLTWEYFRSKAVKHLGEPVVAGIEKAVEIFTIVKSKGVMGLWEYIKEQFGNLKEMVMDAIRDMIITKVIEAGIKWVMGLLSPAGAFVKAAMMIIDIVKFFVERAAQIFELVTAFIDSIKALASGNVKAVAKGIETALAKAIPVLISFLAALVGITGLTGKIQKIINKVRKKIDKAIDKIIFKAKKMFNKILGKKKPKKGAAKKIKDDNKKQKPAELTAKDKAKHKKIATTIKNKLSEKAKKDESFEVFHKRKKKEAKAFEDKYQPQLKKGINIDVSVTPLESDKKDNDVDFKIKIAPNNTTEEGAAVHEFGNIEELEKEPQILSQLGKKVTDNNDEITPEFKAKLGNHADNKLKFKGEKKENQAYQLMSKTGKINKVSFKGKTNPLPALYIDGSDTDDNYADQGKLKKGASKNYKKTHGHYKPDKITMTYNKATKKYLAEYTTKPYTGEDKGKNNPKFKIEISYGEVAKGSNDFKENRSVFGDNLVFKPEGNPRGTTDSAANGFDNAHLIGDRFGGSGKNAALNIYPSSPDYNRKAMLGVENKMAAVFSDPSVSTFDLNVSATIKHEKGDNLNQLLEKEFAKDNPKFNPEKFKGLDEKQVKGKLVKVLQKEINEDLKELPGQFLNVFYKSSGYEFTKKQMVTDPNDPNYKADFNQHTFGNKTAKLGVDSSYDNIIKDHKAMQDETQTESAS